MEENQIQGKWDVIKGKAKESWSKLTNDDLMYISEKKDQLIGKLQEKYGIAKEEAEKQVKDF